MLPSSTKADGGFLPPIAPTSTNMSRTIASCLVQSILLKSNDECCSAEGEGDVSTPCPPLPQPSKHAGPSAFTDHPMNTTFNTSVGSTQCISEDCLDLPRPKRTVPRDPSKFNALLHHSRRFYFSSYDKDRRWDGGSHKPQSPRPEKKELTRGEVVSRTRSYLTSCHVTVLDLPLRLQQAVEDAYRRGRGSCDARVRHLEEAVRALTDQKKKCEDKLMTMRVGRSLIFHDIG